VELASTLAAELESTGVKTFTIGPGLARTPGAMEGIEQIAPLYGKSVEEFMRMSENAMISPEAAGAGFAAAIARAEYYHSQETSSYQALSDIGISLEQNRGVRKLNEAEQADALRLLNSIHDTLQEQARGWNERPVFERQWVLRDYKKYCGIAPEQTLSLLCDLTDAVIQSAQLPQDILNHLQLGKLSGYWQHQIELLQGYEHNKQKVQDYTALMRGWIQTIDAFTAQYTGQ
jgi:hypothetical protein